MLARYLVCTAIVLGAPAIASAAERPVMLNSSRRRAVRLVLRLKRS